MIQAIRGLSPESQRELAGILEPSSRWQSGEDGPALEELVTTLRRVLDVPKAGDLGEYLRRRLVETVTGHFGLVDDTDLLTDAELAGILLQFVYEAADVMLGESESRIEFETFLRTKSKTERTRLLVESRRFAALVTDRAFDIAEERKQATRLQDQDEAHALTARAILDGLAVAPPATQPRRGSVQDIRSRTVAASIAPPLGALAGGLFMAGLRRGADGNGLDGPGSSDSVGSLRRQRARRSTLVQAVVIICAFVAGGVDPNDAGPARS